MDARPARVASTDGRPPCRAAADGLSAVMVAALILLRISIGVFMFFFGFDKVRWLIDGTLLATQLSSWLLVAPPVSRWYLERIIPGAPVFARAVPLAAM